MSFRKLRIAWSVGCAIACVLLIALWMRSYWWTDGVNGQVSATYAVGFGSMPGCIGLRIYPNPHRPLLPRWTLTTVASDRWMDSARHSAFAPSRLWGAFYAESFFVTVPDWFAIALSAALAAIPALPSLGWRYSLRTLLIATTLVAAVLGLIVAVL